MGIPIKIKRTSTADTAPATTDLELGELAINTNDGKLFFKQDRNGVESVREITPTEDYLNGNLDVDIIPLRNEVINLGSPTNRFYELFLAGNTIDIGGATISSDGSGNITISANGAILPAGSKVSSGGLQQEIATVAASIIDEEGNEQSLGLNDQMQSINVPFFTNERGLGSRETTFAFKQNITDARIFKNFTLASGDRITSGITLFSF
jgi:hypothetical protein